MPKRAASSESHSSSSGHGGRDRAAQPLEPALEVDERAVALEGARARQDEVGPTGGEAVEHRDRDHRVGLLGERAHVRVVPAASSPETSSRPIELLPRSPRRSTPPRRRRRRARSASREGRRRRSPPCRRGRAARRAARRSRRRGRRVPTRRGRRGSALRTASSSSSVRTRAPFRRAALIQRSTIGARSLDRHVAEDDDDLRVADRRERQPVRVERAGDLLGEHRLVRRRARGAGARRARTPARPSRSPRAR